MLQKKNLKYFETLFRILSHFYSVFIETDKHLLIYKIISFASFQIFLMRSKLSRKKSESNYNKVEFGNFEKFNFLTKWMSSKV